MRKTAWVASPGVSFLERPLSTSVRSYRGKELLKSYTEGHSPAPWVAKSGQSFRAAVCLPPDEACFPHSLESVLGCWFLCLKAAVPQRDLFMQKHLLQLAHQGAYPRLNTLSQLPILWQKNWDSTGKCLAGHTQGVCIANHAPSSFYIDTCLCLPHGCWDLHPHSDGMHRCGLGHCLGEGDVFLGKDSILFASSIWGSSKKANCQKVRLG